MHDSCRIQARSIDKHIYCKDTSHSTEHAAPASHTCDVQPKLMPQPHTLYQTDQKQTSSGRLSSCKYSCRPRTTNLTCLLTACDAITRLVRCPHQCLCCYTHIPPWQSKASLTGSRSPSLITTQHCWDECGLCQANPRPEQLNNSPATAPLLMAAEALPQACPSATYDQMSRM